MDCQECWAMDWQCDHIKQRILINEDNIVMCSLLKIIIKLLLLS